MTDSNDPRRQAARQDAFEKLREAQHRYSIQRHEDCSRGVLALLRLIDVAKGASGQSKRVARLLAGIHNGIVYPIDPADLRALDVELSDDVLSVLAMDRWASADICRLIPDGERVFADLIRDWGLDKPDN